MQGIRIEDDEFADLIRGDVDEDLVNHPRHYQMTLPNGDPVEAIDIIQAALGAAGTVAYCRGAAIKYLMRADKKENHARDLRKAAWYCSHAATILEDEAPED